MKCLCGREATHKAWLPSNVYAELRQMMEEHKVCQYHADKATVRGFEVKPLGRR